MKLARVLRISRPRFWIYELGPYMIGILAALLMWKDFHMLETGMRLDIVSVLMISNIFVLIGFALYFLVPANIWIYGINDIFDYETDKLNPKKLEGYEALVTPDEQANLWKWIIWTTVPFAGLLLVYAGNPDPLLSLIGFLFFSGMYSAYPIRAKAKPIIDMIFSAGHYVMTALFAWTLIAPISNINWWYVVAGMCWCMAMHLYSAVPDIVADRDAGLSTTAMLTGERVGLVLCAIFYLLASVLSYSALGAVSVILGVVYLAMMIRTLVRLQDISQIYRYFPWINMVSGMIIFLVLLYTLIYG